TPFATSGCLTDDALGCPRSAATGRLPRRTPRARPAPSARRGPAPARPDDAAVHGTLRPARAQRPVQRPARSPRADHAAVDERGRRRPRGEGPRPPAFRPGPRPYPAHGADRARRRVPRRSGRHRGRDRGADAGGARPARARAPPRLARELRAHARRRDRVRLLGLAPSRGSPARPRRALELLGQLGAEPALVVLADGRLRDLVHDADEVREPPARHAAAQEVDQLPGLDPPPGGGDDERGRPLAPLRVRMPTTTASPTAGWVARACSSS